jgi:hypothetical protein
VLHTLKGNSFFTTAEHLSGGTVGFFFLPEYKKLRLYILRARPINIFTGDVSPEVFKRSRCWVFCTDGQVLAETAVSRMACWLYTVDIFYKKAMRCLVKGCK